MRVERVNLTQTGLAAQKAPPRESGLVNPGSSSAPAAIYEQGPKDGELGGVSYGPGGKLKITSSSRYSTEGWVFVQTPEPPTPLGDLAKK